MNWIRVSRAAALLFLMLIGAAVCAQDDNMEPTDRPFPVQAAATTAPPAEPTDRPFPGQNTTATIAPANPPAVTPEATAELTLDQALATAAAAEQRITELQSEIERLTVDLTASQADNGATLFALVIVVIGVLLALAVFFGLRRSGE